MAVETTNLSDEQIFNRVYDDVANALRTTDSGSTFPVDVGQTTKSGSLPVTLASDQDALSVTGTITATGTLTIAPGGTLTAKNGTITSGGVAQTLAALNASRRYLLVQNQSVENLYISFTGAAVQDRTSLRLTPGDTWESPTGFCPTQACSIIGATTGSAFHAVEG